MAFRRLLIWIDTLILAFVILPWQLPHAETDGIVVTDIMVSNITSCYAVISFVASEPVVGFVKYGENPNRLNMTAEDESMRSTGIVYIHLFNLKPKTTYYFSVHAFNDRASVMDDNNGALYSFDTANEVTGTSPLPIYGTVFYETEDGAKAPVEGGLVCVIVRRGKEVSQPLTNITDNLNGSFMLSLGNLKSKDGNEFGLNTGDEIIIRGEGGPYGQTEKIITYTDWEYKHVTLVLTLGEPTKEKGLEAPKPTEISEEERVTRQGQILIVLILLAVVIVIIGRVYFSVSKGKKPESREKEESE